MKNKETRPISTIIMFRQTLRNCLLFFLHKQLFDGDAMEKRSRENGHVHGRITINVGGIRHETYLTTLRNRPDTR